MMRGACLAGTALLLIGCAHTEAVNDDGLSARQREARLGGISDWDMYGQIIVDNGERRQRLRADWEQRGERLSLEVDGRGVAALAQGFRISGTPEQLIIEGRGETRTLDDPETDLYYELGYWLPVRSLPYWLRGLEDPDYPAQRSRGLSGTLATLSQRDWRVTYAQYQLAAGLLVPSEMTLNHESLELRLNISRWEPATD